MNETNAQRGRKRPAKPLQSLRKVARAMVKTSEVSHTAALDELARQRGARSWAHLVARHTRESDQQEGQATGLRESDSLTGGAA